MAAVPKLPLDIMDKILRMSSDESYRRFCRNKLVSKGAINDSPFKLKFNSIEEFYSHNADKYTLAECRNPDPENRETVVDFLSQFKLMVVAESHLHPGAFSWVYRTILYGFIYGECSFSNESEDKTRLHTLEYVIAKLLL